MRRPSGAFPRADEENRADFLKIFLVVENCGAERQRAAALLDAKRSRKPSNRAERPGVRRPSGAFPRADEENRTDFLKLF